MEETKEKFRALPVADALARHFTVLRHHYSAALEENQDTAEAVHKARVATRRLQADLDLLQFGRNADTVREIKQRLRDFRNGLSALRNYDVFVGIVHAAFEKADDEESPALTLLEQRLREERDVCAAEARKLLRRFKIKRLAASLALPEEGDGNGKRKKALELVNFSQSKLKRRTARRLEARLAEFLSLVSRLKDASDTEGIHQLRIAAKRLRYLLETLADLGYREPKGAVRWLRNEQGKIGDWHDLVVLEEQVLALAAKKGAVSRNLDESAALLRATARLVQARDRRASRTFPVKPPNYFERSIRRLVADIRGDKLTD